MASFQLSADAIDTIRSSGWREARTEDVEGVISLLTAKGIGASPVAIEFLREFHGLKLRLPNGGLPWVTFDVNEEMKFIEEGEIIRLESLVKQPLCPVGLGGAFLLFVTPQGEMVFLHDEWLLYIRARSIHDGFEVIRTLNFRDYESVMLTDEEKPRAFHA
jgi:hypothetical protein